MKFLQSRFADNNLNEAKNKIMSSLLPDSYWQFLLGLEPLSAAGSKNRRQLLPRWKQQAQARIDEAIAKLCHYQAQPDSSLRRRMMTYWQGRLRYAVKSLTELQAEEAGTLIPMVNNGVHLVAIETLELLRLKRAESKI